MSDRLKLVHIDRIIEPDTIIGSRGELCVIWDDICKFECQTLEQGWFNNAPYESCIPEGLYKIKLSTFRGLYQAYEVLNVPGRSGIKIHKGNKLSDILGCIILGKNSIRQDNQIFLQYSSDAFEEFMHVMLEKDMDLIGNEAWLSISNIFL